MSKIIGIYKITSPSGKIYIGQAVDIERRFKNHKWCIPKIKTLLNSSFKKYGFNSHQFEVIEECSRNQLNEREIFWIKHFNTFDTEHGLNMKIGGDVHILSIETRAKISASNKGKIISHEARLKMSKNSSRHNLGKKATPETREKIRQARLLQSDPNLGKKRSDEIKKKFSDMRKGKKPSQKTIDAQKLGREKVKDQFNALMRDPDRIAKISAKNRGRKRTQEVKDKLSKSWDYNKHFSEETKRKISEGNRRRWERYRNNKAA